MELVSFPKPVVVALSMVVKYITGELRDSAGGLPVPEFKLQEVFRHRSAFTRVSWTLHTSG